ncbi:S8 family peptidase [Cardiobacteriaceae bacterium TAE3-ERU3]|nr:S8 family peptidase [Cardiobacteriaceae bacterium TAE3-ERU3]
MKKNKSHLFFSTTEQYDYYAQPSKGGGLVLSNIKNNIEHGNKLLDQLEKSIQKINSTKLAFNNETGKGVSPLVCDKGIFLSIVSDPEEELDASKFDNTSFKLKTLKYEDSSQVITFYTSKENQDKFSQKIQQFINEKTKTEKPKNLQMLNNVSKIRPSTLEDLWNDDLKLLPENDDTVACEIWISFSDDEEKNQFILRVGDDLSFISKSHISLPTITIFKARATRRQLEKLVTDYPDIIEFRVSTESPSVLIEMEPRDQLEFTEDFNNRIRLNDDANIFVTILDTGINYNNPILRKVCKASYCVSWDSKWANYDDQYISLSPVYHGSYQAGVAAYGANLVDYLMSSESIELTHKIESGRILPPPPLANPEELYGAVTLDTINKLVVDRPYSKRVYSLAVTNPSSGHNGYPTSWSTAIDNFCFTEFQENSDIFVISAGNAPGVQKDYWENARSARVNDPAQAWNAVTVGSYTKLYDAKGINNPIICSQVNDINPTTSSSHDWEWGDAPFKPDILCEGGNRLILSDGSIDFHEDLSILTASGKTQGNLFASHTDTSAATAEASYIAAKIMSVYPNAKAETIRGLLIHSAEWSAPINDKLSEIAKLDNSKGVKKDHIKQIFKVCGYGIPNLEKAIASKNDRLTLIIESSLKPFDQTANFKLNQFNLHDLPWPTKVLNELPLDSKVKMTVTLSYFVEPNPRVSNIKSKYVYRSHGLTFNLCKPGQNKQDFIDSINRSDHRSENYTEHSFSHGWFFGSQLQKYGSIHKDYWVGTAAELSQVFMIAVKPVTGWWKQNKDEERCTKYVNYTLIVTLEVDNIEVDIYSEVENKIKSVIKTPVIIESNE